jgi:hypothetical protein
MKMKFLIFGLSLTLLTSCEKESPTPQDVSPVLSSLEELKVKFNLKENLSNAEIDDSLKFNDVASAEAFLNKFKKQDLFSPGNSGSRNRISLKAAPSGCTVKTNGNLVTLTSSASSYFPGMNFSVTLNTKDPSSIPVTSILTGVTYVFTWTQTGSDAQADNGTITVTIQGDMFLGLSVAGTNLGYSTPASVNVTYYEDTNTCTMTGGADEDYADSKNHTTPTKQQPIQK